MTSPVPLKTAVYIYQRGSSENWLTNKRLANNQIRLDPSKSNATRWVIEKVGVNYTIRLMNTKTYLAAGSPTATGDCTAIFTATPSGQSHYWSLTPSSTGVRIKTVAPCLEKGKQVVQYLKVAQSGGAHLELASKDSDVFYILPVNPTSAPTATQSPTPLPTQPSPTTKPIVTAPAPAPQAMQLTIYPASQIPKIVAIEPYLRPKYYLAPKMLPTATTTEGSLDIVPRRTLWFTRATPTATTLSLHYGKISGPHVAVSRTCSAPLLSNTVVSNQGQFAIGAVSGQDGFVMRTPSTACSDGKPRYLILYTNGAAGITPVAPTPKTIHQYLWRFSVGTFAPSPTPTATPTPPPIVVTQPAPIVTQPAPVVTEPAITQNPGTTVPPLQPINITVDTGRDPQVVFPYPVSPDLLIGMNPDGSLTTSNLMTGTPTPTAEATEITPPPSETPLPTDEDMTIPEFGEDEEILDSDYEPFWTLPRILIAMIALAALGAGGYYLYKKMSGGSSNNVNATANQNLGVGNLNLPPANTTNVGDLGGDFGDGFNNFANVENIGPPPPSAR